MNLLLDQGLPRSAAPLLRNAGVPATHVAELSLHAAEDAVLLQHARDHDLTIVTLDADFHAMLAHSGERRPSVVRIRVEGLKGPAITDLLLQVLATCSADLLAGSVVTVTADNVRVRRLPLSNPEPKPQARSC